MKNRTIIRGLTLAVILSCNADLLAAERLPEGRNGIAARFPGDHNIKDSAAVIFVERFDAGSVDELSERWEGTKGKSQWSLSSDIPANASDAKSLQIRYVGGKGNGAHLYRRFKRGYEKLYYRFYVKFSPNCQPIHHFFHVGGYHPSTAWPQGGAGERPKGGERFTTGVEPFGRNWRWDYYSYWMDMRGSPPRGQYWGNSFMQDEAPKVRRGEWICVELMMKLNDVGKSNGEMALWIDGKLASHIGQGFPKGKWVYDKFFPQRGGDGIRWNEKTSKPEQIRFKPGGEPFEGFQWRSNEKLDLNFLWLLCYITKAEPGSVSKIWFDNVVVAEDYIGPIQKRGK